MSLESLKQLILGEAQKEADKIISDARQKVCEIKEESQAKAKDRIKQLEKEFERKTNTLEASYNSKQSSFQKSAELSAVHSAVESAVMRSCDILLSNSVIRDSVRNWAEKMIANQDAQSEPTRILQIGKRIDESLPEIRDIAKKSGVPLRFVQEIMH